MDSSCPPVSMGFYLSGQYLLNCFFLQPVLVWQYTIRARVTCIKIWLLWSRSQCSNYRGDDDFVFMLVLLWFTSPTSDVHVHTCYIVRAGKLLRWFTFCVSLPPLTSIPQVDAMILQVDSCWLTRAYCLIGAEFDNHGLCAAFRDFHVAFPVFPADGRDWPHTGTAPVASGVLCRVPGWQIPKTGWPEQSPCAEFHGLPDVLIQHMSIQAHRDGWLFRFWFGFSHWGSHHLFPELRLNE